MTCSGGLAGLVKASSQPPALVLRDLMMPDRGGSVSWRRCVTTPSSRRCP